MQQLPYITVVAGYPTKYSVVANYRPPITVQYRGSCLPRQTLPRSKVDTEESPGKYSSQLYDRRNARLLLKIRLFKAEEMEAMLYGCATWSMRSQDFSSLRIAHLKLLFFVHHRFSAQGPVVAGTMVEVVGTVGFC